MIKYQESEEMYLETILLLRKEKDFVRSIDIANALSYSRASVCRGVALLSKKGLAQMSSKGDVELTDAGLKKANEIYERHCVITKLLTNLGADISVAEENACKIEHVISPELFEILKKYVNSNDKHSS
jgi:Mn-dependent DtxR family transcriptional regulator